MAYAETVSWWLLFIGELFCHIYDQVNKKISQKCFCRNKTIRPKNLWRTWGDRWNWWQLRPTFFSETWNSHWPVPKNCAMINCVSCQIDGSCCLEVRDRTSSAPCQRTWGLPAFIEAEHRWTLIHTAGPRPEQQYADGRGRAYINRTPTNMGLLLNCIWQASLM